MTVSVKAVKIRAKVVFNGVTIETPYIKSFSVTRSRKQMCAQFSATLRVPADTSFDGVASKVEISAGESTTKKIFTGYVHVITIHPCREDSHFVIVDISGKDVLYRLEGQRFTRRVSATNLERFGAITSTIQENEKYKERFPAKIYNNEERLISHQILDADGAVVLAPSPPSFRSVDEVAVGGPVKMSVRILPKESK